MLYYPYAKEKEAVDMPTEKETIIVQKATVYDIQKILESSGKDTLTVDEIKKLMDAYIAGLQQ